MTQTERKAQGVKQGNGVRPGSQGNLSFVRQTTGEGLRQKEWPCKKTQRCKRSDRGNGDLSGFTREKEGQNWKFAPSRGRVHRTCNDSI